LINFILKITLIIGAFYLSACSTTKSATIFAPVTAESGQAVVYIYLRSSVDDLFFCFSQNYARHVIL